MELAFIFFVKSAFISGVSPSFSWFSKREHLEIIGTGFITDWILFLLPS